MLLVLGFGMWESRCPTKGEYLHFFSVTGVTAQALASYLRSFFKSQKLHARNIRTFSKFLYHGTIAWDLHYDCSMNVSNFSKMSSQC